MDENKFECCEQCYEDVIAIPTEEYKKLVRCEQSLKLLFHVDKYKMYSSELSTFMKILKLMHPDLLPEEKEVTEDAE